MIAAGCSDRSVRAGQYYRQAIRVSSYAQGTNVDSVRYAVKLLDKAVKLNPQSVKYQQTRASMLLSLGRFAEAYQAYASIVELSPDNPNDQISFGLMADKNGHADQANAAYKKAIELYDARLAANPSDMNTIFSRLTARLLLEDHAQMGKYRAQTDSLMAKYIDNEKDRASYEMLETILFDSLTKENYIKMFDANLINKKAFEQGQ